MKNLNLVDRQGEFELELEEDNQGTYFFNSKDLNLLNHLSDLIDAGVTSFKIEGRNKSVYYLATVIRAYRNTLDNLVEGKDVSDKEQKNLNNLVHRGYTTGFLLGNEPEHNFENSHNESKYEFVGEVIEGEKDGIVKVHPVKSGKAGAEQFIRVKAHNAIYSDDELELVDNNGNHSVNVSEIYNEKMEKEESAHGGHKDMYYFKVDRKNIQPMSLLRKKVQ